MKKLLLANIGNRNLLYRGKPIPQYLQANPAQVGGTAFFDFTKHLLENYEQEKPHLQPEILPTLLDKLRPEVDEVLLFGTDMKPEDNKSQDTRFAAELLARLLPEYYPELTFRTQIVACKVYDNEELLRFYRRFLQSLKKEQPRRPLLICDAGGTAQQKASLKIMAEYLYPEDQYEVYYVAKAPNEPSRVDPVKPLEYRRIIDAEQARALIRQSNYLGAYQVIQTKAGKISPSYLGNLLQFAAFRFGFVTNKAPGFAKPDNYGKNYSRFPFLAEYDRQEPQGQHTPFAGVLSRASFFQLAELLAIAQRQYQLGDHTQSVLRVNQFIESYPKLVVQDQFDYSLSGSTYDKEISRLIRDCPAAYPEVFGRLEQEELRPGQPLLLAVAHTHPDPLHRQVLDLIESSLAYFLVRKGKTVAGIDSMRNRIVHDGQGFSPEEVKRELPFFGERLNRLLELWQLPEQNIYDRMNETLEELL